MESKRFGTELFTLFYRKGDKFSYQVLFSKKMKLNHPNQNKIKRQIREIVKNKQFSSLNTQTIFLLRSPKLPSFSELETDLGLIKEKLKTINTL